MAFLALVLLCNCHGWTTDWPHFMGPDRNATTPDEPAGATLGLHLKWRTALPFSGSAASFSSMAVVQNRVYTLSTIGLEVLDAGTGQRIWTKTNTGKYHSTPAVCDGRVYLYDGASTLSCLSAEDGEVLWWQAASNHVTGYLVFSDASLSALVTDGRVVVLARGQTNTVMAFNSTNGTLVWKEPAH